MSHQVAALANVIMKMNSCTDASSLVASTLDGNRSDMMRLKLEVGNVLRPLLGFYNGYFILDLSLSTDRECLTKLIEISSTYAEKRKNASLFGYGRVGDLSQHGNWSCFRNERYEGQAVEINSAFASPVPTKGVLDFDFVEAADPPVGDPVMNDGRFIKVKEIFRVRVMGMCV